MHYTFYAYTKIKEKNKRMKFQLIAMGLFLIAIMLEMIYSKYYMLVLFAPFFILLYNYINLRKRMFHYQRCKIDFFFTKKSFRLIFDEMPGKGCFDYLIQRENIEHIDFFDNGNTIIVCKNFMEDGNKLIKKKTFDLMFELDDKNALQDAMKNFIENK